MILNVFFKLYDLNGDNCTKNNVHLFSTEYCFRAVLMRFKELAVKIKTAG